MIKTNVEYFNCVVEKIVQRRKKAHPYGEDTTEEDMNDLLTSIAASLARIADALEYQNAVPKMEEGHDDNG